MAGVAAAYQASLIFRVCTTQKNTTMDTASCMRDNRSYRDASWPHKTGHTYHTRATVRQGEWVGYTFTGATSFALQLATTKSQTCH